MAIAMGAMSTRNSFLRRCGVALVAAPVFGAGLIHCTFDGLNALGAGSPEAGISEDSGGESKTPVADSAPPTDVTQSPPGLDSSTPPAADSAPPPVTDAAGDAGADSAVPPPLAALPIFLDASTSGGWCSQHLGYAFCADFDETPLPAGFSASDGAFIAQTSSVASSAPNDLLLWVPPQSGTGTWGSKLSRQFDTAATSIILAFDINPETLNTTSNGMLFAGLDFLGNANAKYSLRLAYNSGAPRLEESYLGTPADVYHSNFTIPLGSWSRIQVEITFPPATDGGGGADAGSASETIYVNSVLQGTSEVLAPPAGFDQRPNFLIGAVYGTSPSNTWVIRYDNVTLDIQ
jgi:hypothetical protein